MFKFERLGRGQHSYCFTPEITTIRRKIKFVLFRTTETDGPNETERISE